MVRVLVSGQLSHAMVDRGLLPVMPALGGGALSGRATLTVTGRLHGQGQVLIEADGEYGHGLGAQVTAGQAQLGCEADRIS